MNGTAPRRFNDATAAVEAKLLRWIAGQVDPFTIDAAGVLGVGREPEAVITNTRTGRQGLWPAAWEVVAEVVAEDLPLFRLPPKKQRALFE